MSIEKEVVTLTTMPGGELSFRSFDERIQGQLLEHAWAIATADTLGELAPVREDYRLQITAPLEIPGRPNAVLDARLQIPKGDYNAFLYPALPKKDEPKDVETPEEPGALDIFMQTDEEQETDDEDALHKIFKEHRLRGAAAHQQRMEIIVRAANWLTDMQFLDKLLDSYGHKPFGQREGVALTARDVGQWLTITDEGAESPRWGFFMPNTSHSRHQGDDSWYFARHVSPITGEQIESDNPDFREKVAEDLGFAAQAIKKVVEGYNTEMEEKGFLPPDYGTVPMVGLTSYKDYYEGYTEFAPRGHSLVSASLEQAHYGVLAEDYRTGILTVQTVFKETDKSQPLVGSFYLPYGSTESTFFVYRADTSGQPAGSGIREHAFKGMYGEDKKPVRFAPANFYATVQFLHSLAKSASTSER
jgi:hypothetical protein